MEISQRTFCVGDIHGEYDKLEKVLELSTFNKEKDLLITLGDIVDRGKDWRKCVDILFTIKNRIDILGNHDQSFLYYIDTDIDMFGGNYGSAKTIEQYKEILDKKPYENFFRNQIPFYVDNENRCFVHAGFDREYSIKDNMVDTLCWDRKLLAKALSCSPGDRLKTIDDFKEIYIGHTPTFLYNKKGKIPTFSGELIWNLDTGSGKDGLLTMMNIDTKEYWQA